MMIAEICLGCKHHNVCTDGKFKDCKFKDYSEQELVEMTNHITRQRNFYKKQVEQLKQ